MEDEITMLKEKHEHAQKLPGVKLPEDMEFTTDLESAVSGKAYLILAVPSVFTRSTAKSMAPFVKEGQIIVCVAKGIEEETLMPLTDIVEQRFRSRGCSDVWTKPCGRSWNRTSNYSCSEEQKNVLLQRKSRIFS